MLLRIDVSATSVCGHRCPGAYASLLPADLSPSVLSVKHTRGVVATTPLAQPAATDR
jgi:hypothetical protein